MSKSIEERRRRVQETCQLDPLVPITLKGNNYTLELNNRAVKRIYTDCGHNLLTEGLNLEAMQDPNIIGSILFRALETHHPDITSQDDVDVMFTYRHMAYILDCIRQAIDLFMPAEADIDELSPEVKAQAEEEAGLKDPTLQPTLVS